MKKILEDLNDPQKEAVTHTDGPLLVLAGAGSGKTRVITRRIAFLISEKGVHPGNIMAVTFTNKAAREMKDRIWNLLDDVHIPWMGTFHAMCARILRIELSKIAEEGTGVYHRHDFTILDSGDQLSLVKEAMADFDLDEKAYDPRRMRRGISFAKNQLKKPDELKSEAHGDFPKKLADVYENYQKKLKENNCMDFDDLIMETYYLLKDHEQVRDKYQDRFHHILIDEYQDVNVAQYKLTKLLSEKHGNICAVGDDDQSIYGFRGSDVSIILRFEEDFPGAKIVKLEENYRSTSVILKAAHAVISKNEGRKQKELFTNKEIGEKIGSHASQEGRDEAKYVADEIEKWSQEGMKFKDFVILYRTNAQSRSMEEVLRQKGIPYEIVGGLRFYERAEIKDAMAYMKLLINPNDRVSFRRIINIPHRGIGSVTQEKIIQKSIESEQNLIEVIEHASDLPRVGKKIEKTLDEFVKTVKMLQSDKNDGMPVSKLLHKTLQNVGYYAMIEESEDPKKFDRLDNIDELINDAKEFERYAEDKSLEAFLEKTTLKSDIDEKHDPTVEDEGTITLMTVHSAKGLEFPVVFIIGLEEGLFPHFRAIQEGSKAALEEERRLFYVAMTRAIRKLYLTYARERTIHGKFHKQSHSRFFQEVPEELIDHYMPEFSKRTFTRKTQSLLDKQSEKMLQDAKFKNGQSVYHKIFGKGKVKKTEKGYVTVDFKTHGIKILQQDFLQPASEAKKKEELKPGDSVRVKDGPEGILKKTEGRSAYIIVSGGDVEKVAKSKVELVNK